MQLYFALLMNELVTYFMFVCNSGCHKVDYLVP